MGGGPPDRPHDVHRPLAEGRRVRPDRRRGAGGERDPAALRAGPPVRSPLQGTGCRRRRAHPHAQGQAPGHRRAVRRSHRGLVWNVCGPDPGARHDHVPGRHDRGGGDRRAGGGGRGRMTASLSIFLQLLTNGIVVGMVYALAALGFVLIYKASRVINLAQGYFVALGAFGALAIAQAFLAVFVVFFRRTTLGVAMRAVADDQQAAQSLGVSVRRVFAASWAIAATVAAVGGVVVGSLNGLNADALSFIGLKVFPAVILGGLDSVPGAVVGGVTVGVLENLAGGYIDPLVGGGAKEVAPFVVLVLALMVRPYGLFGTVEIERV